MNKLFVFLLAFWLCSCSVVGPQQRGVRIVGGRATEVLESGIHPWFPIMYGVARLNLSIQKNDIEATAASKDMQNVVTHVAVNWSVDPAKVLELYRTIGDEDDVLARIITPATNEVLKAATAKKTAEEILTQRIALKSEIDVSLKSRLDRYGVILQDVSIVNLEFSHEFTRAIEEKQIAEQQAKQATYLAVKSKNDAVARVNAARGDAEAQQLVRSSLTPEIIRMKAVEKWDGHFPQVMGQATLPFLNLDNLKSNGSTEDTE